MNDQTFHYFPKLPAEIRITIWKLCLPNRVVEYDGPWFLHDGFRARQMCYSKSTIDRHCRIPTLASVNYEARQVTLRCGQLLQRPPKSAWLDSTWIQPRHDVLHLNWVRCCWAALFTADHHFSAGIIGPFIAKASSLRMQKVSVTAHAITPFRLDTLVDGYDSSGINEGTFGELATHPEDFYDFGDAAFNNDLPKELYVAMAAVSLHVREDAACKSGLFGLLGDEPVQMVDADNIVRLGKFEEFFHRHTTGESKEPKVWTLFELFKTSKFQDAVRNWKKLADRLLLEDFWYWAQNCELISDDEFDESHPFMHEAREITLRTRPQVMIRYCTNQCYMKESQEMPDPSF